MLTFVGQAVSRRDGVAKVTGQGRYVAEVPRPGLLHAVIVTSTIARGEIRSVDLPAASVAGIWTHENFPKLNPAPVLLQAGGSRRAPKGSAGQQRLPMQDNRVEYFGEPVAVVVAETLESAQDAAARIRIRYAPEPPLIDFDAQLPHAFEPKDVWGDPQRYARGDVQKALAAALVRIEQVYHTPVQHHVTMEPHAAMAEWHDGKLTVHQTTSWIGGGRKTLATWFDLDEADVRVLNEFVGGSFGSKGPTWPHVAICAAVARQLGRPVRLALTRRQTFTDAGRRPELRHEIKLGADASGKLLAFSYDTVAETAVFDDRVVAPTTRTPPRLYACANVSTSYRLVHLNRSGPFTMRGPGETPALFALETAMDELAYALKLDPVELRLRNHAEQDPTENQPWSSKHLRECYQQGAQRFGWSRRAPQPRSMRDGEELIGWGMASMIYDARSGAAEATATLGADGRITLRCATVDAGTGPYTIFPQIAADLLGVPLETVSLQLGDSAFPMAPIAAGSQTTATVGTAVQAAATDLHRKIILLAITTARSPLAGLAETDVRVEQGILRGGGRQLPLVNLLPMASQQELVGAGKGTAIKETAGVSRFSFGAHFAEVRVDESLRRVRVTRYVGAFAAGKIINPKTAHSQLLGGIAWGIGQALMEQTVVCPRSGRYVNDDLENYLVPTNADVPEIEAFFIPEQDEQVNPLGVKGIGEIGTIGSAPAIANAFYHATGQRVRRLPIIAEEW